MNILKSLTFNAKLFYVLVLGVFVAILMRNSALYPSIFADEYVYSSSARLYPLSQASIANYLYLWVYRLTNVCGDGFLSCARILNATFFILACPFIYQTAKRVCSKSIAKYIAILSLIGPINIYTANFMPEAMYFLGFWIFAWYILGLNSTSTLRSWFGVGTLIGICMLIKPHGVFLLLPITLYLIVIFSGQEFFPTSKFLCAVGGVICGALLTKFILGFLIAGENGLSFLGHLYSATTQDFFNATITTNGSSNLTELTAGTVSLPSESSSYLMKWISGLMALLNFWRINIFGHILGLCLLFGVPLLSVLRLLGSPLNEFSFKPIQKNYAWFAFLLIFFLMLVSSLYSSLVTLSSNGEILRMHMRYYNFAFPLLLMLFSFALGGSTEQIFTKKLNYFEIVLWVLVSGILLWGYWNMMAPYQPTAIDMPELRGIMQFKGIFYTLIGLGFLSLLIWPISRKTAIKFFFWVLAPLSLIGGSIGVNQNIWQALKPNIYDRAGIVTKQLLNQQELSQLVVAGDNPIELSRVLFHLDHPGIAVQTMKGGVPYEANMLPSDKKWVLLLDDHIMANNIQNQLNFGDFTLGGGSGQIKIDFRNQAWPSKDLIFTSGLFIPPEPWGSWSIDKKVKLVFKKPLPEQFDLKISAKAYGFNIQNKFILDIGGKKTAFKIGKDFEIITLSLQNPGRSNVIMIEIPEPVSPKSLGLGTDQRMLGLGIEALDVLW